MSIKPPTRIQEYLLALFNNHGLRNTMHVRIAKYCSIAMRIMWQNHSHRPGGAAMSITSSQRRLGKNFSSANDHVVLHLVQIRDGNFRKPLTLLVMIYGVLF